jgi:hypothetical protein
MTPYFPRQIQWTFSHVSMLTTIDLKSSAIIASAFAFISRVIAFPFLRNFLDSTPVFHHFALSDPIFSEHLSSIVSNLGNLGLDWYRTLLHSFLTGAAASRDQALLRTIVAIVRHHPADLMREVLDFVRGQSNFAAFLPLVSFVLSSRRFPLDELELFPVACQCLQILSDADAKVTELDSALQVLALKSDSFSVTVESVSDLVVRLVVAKASDRRDAEIAIGGLKGRPSLWLLNVPFHYAVPDFEADGALIITSKFAALANCVNRSPEHASTLLNLIEYHLHKPSSAVFSACLKSLATCLDAFAKIDVRRLNKLIDDTVSMETTSWYQAVDLLRVIKAAGPNSAVLPNSFSKVLGIVVDLCMSNHDKLESKAKKCLVRITNEANFEDVTLFVARRIDFMDESNLTKLLGVLATLLEKWKKSVHLSGLVCQVLEIVQLNRGNLAVLDACFLFLGTCDLSFIDDNLLLDCLEQAMTNAMGFFIVFSGEDWKEAIKSTRLQQSVAIVDAHLKSQCVDMVTESSLLSYQRYCRCVSTATALISSVPLKLIDTTFAFTFVNQLLKIFPLHAAELLRKLWSKFSGDEQIDLLKAAMVRLRYTQDFDAAAIIFQLFIQQPIEFDEQISLIANFPLENSWTHPTSTQLLYFRAFAHFLTKRGTAGDSELEQMVSKNCSHLFQALFGRLSPPLDLKDIDTAIPTNKSFCFNPISWKVLRRKGFDVKLVRSQLVGRTYEFEVNDLRILFALFCQTTDIESLKVLLNYAQTRKIVLSVNITIVPESCLAAVLSYYSVVDLARFRGIAGSYFGRSYSRAVRLAAISLDRSSYLEQLTIARKHSKDDLNMFIQATSSIQFDSIALQATIENCLKHQISAKKLPLFMTAIANSLSSMTAISGQFIADLVFFFQNRQKELSTLQVARCLHLMILLSSTGRHVTYIIDLLTTAWPISAEGTLLYLAIAKSKELFEPALTKHLREFFNSRIPSFLCCGLRLLSRGLRSDLSDKFVKSTLKHSLSKVIESFTEFARIPSIAETTSQALLLILSSGLESRKKQISLAFNSLMPPVSMAAFSPMSPVLPAILSVALNDRQLSDFAKQIFPFVPTLLINPTHRSFLKVYLKTAVARAQKMSSPGERLAFLMNIVMVYCHDDLCDCHLIADVFYELIKFSLKNHGLSAIWDLVNAKLLAPDFRFFSIFVALLRLGKKLCRKPIVDAEQFTSELKEIGKTIECKCHAAAWQMIGEAGRMGLALQLAQFEGDCEESAFLMGEREAKEGEGDWAAVFETVVGVRLDVASMLDGGQE